MCIRACCARCRRRCWRRAYRAAARLHGLLMFNYAALASLGLSAAALSGFRYALPRLVEGVATQLFLDDREGILGDCFAYADEEFTLRDEV